MMGGIQYFSENSERIPECCWMSSMFSKSLSLILFTNKKKTLKVLLIGCRDISCLPTDASKMTVPKLWWSHSVEGWCTSHQSLRWRNKALHASSCKSLGQQLDGRHINCDPLNRKKFGPAQWNEVIADLRIYKYMYVYRRISCVYIYTYMTLRYIALHHITLHYTTLHLHTYIHVYIYTYTYTYICIYVFILQTRSDMCIESSAKLLSFSTMACHAAFLRL